MIQATYVNHMGDDNSVVDAARVSFDKASGDYSPEANSKLIKYLSDHGHLSPFNHCFATFHVKAPIFVARQLQKHEYMPWNEISRRYVDSEPEFYTPDVWRGRSKDKKQGSEGEVAPKPFDEYWVDCQGGLSIGDTSDYYILAREYYTHLLSEGVSPEQARMVLPQSMMTEWYWSGSLGAFAKMCNLRLKEDTQYETRLVAEQISEKMEELYPVSWKELVKT